jgi:glycosyltransferase involved in cell wall biosynthesis
MTESLSFRYLIVNHVPLGRCASPQHLRVGAMWMHDLRAQRDALRAVGAELIVACPLVDELEIEKSGSFDLVEVDLAAEGFSFVPLPYYESLKGWWKTRHTARAMLAQAIVNADVVHLGDGAHPIPYDAIAWDLARHAGKKIVWVYDGADVLPRLQEHAESRRSALARVAWRYLIRQRERSSRAHVRDADLVFAHNAAVVQRFADAWGPHCHFFDRSFVTDDVLIGAAELDARCEELRDRRRALRLVAAGRQIRIKGTDQVLRAMASARAKGAELELEVFGDGEDLPAFRELARELGLADRVRFLGSVPYGRELFDHLRRSQVMMITNLTPEISRNVLLSMALGLPILGYRNAGTDELLSKSGAGVLTPPGDVEALAGAMLHAAQDRESLVNQARGGRLVAGEKTLEGCHRERARLVGELLSASASAGSDQRSRKPSRM